MKFFKYLLIGIFLISLNIRAQRLVKTINSGWEFQLENSENPEIVNIPHIWNAEDAFNDGDYFRGKGNYKKQIFIPENWKNKSVFLKFEGANQQTRVFVNESLAGKHTGGYTSFIFDLSKYLKFGSSNEIRIEVDNAHNTDIPPLEADFNFYGGIYRDLELITTGKSHFQLEGETAGNLPIKTPEVNAKLAEVIFEGKMVNFKDQLKLQISITDPSGKKVSDYKEPLRSQKFSVNFNIENPRLWSPEKPNLYHLKADLIDSASGDILDSYTSNFGCRWFKTDPEKGFFLNGEPIKLIGANRHQDFENMGNAVSNAIHRKDRLSNDQRYGG